MSESLRVIVVGGGIGGLCLAHGLRRAGVSVQVYERDRSPGARPEGYRIHVNPAGARSLRACLPDDLWQAFLATSGPGGDFGFLTEGLEELLVVEEAIMYPGGVSDPGENHYAVDRRTLRRLLLTGLDDVVAFDAEFVRYEHSADGRVVAVFADGRTAAGDLLIGADGASSRVCRQYLPHAKPVDVGVGGFGHKLYLTEDTRRWVPERLQLGMNSIMANAPMFLFTSVYDPPAHAAAALQAVTGDAPEGITRRMCCARWSPTSPCSRTPWRPWTTKACGTPSTRWCRAGIPRCAASWPSPTRPPAAASSSPPHPRSPPGHPRESRCSATRSTPCPRSAGSAPTPPCVTPGCCASSSAWLPAVTVACSTPWAPTRPRCATTATPPSAPPSLSRTDLWPPGH